MRENSNKMIKSYEDIKNEYGYIRQKNLTAYETRKQELYDKYPKLRELDDNILSTYRNMALSAFNNKANEYEKELDILKKEKDKFLEDNGIEKDYLDVKYDCEICKDTGYVDGKKCSCFIEKEIELFNNLTNASRNIKKYDFSNVNYSYYNQDIVDFKKGTTSAYADYSDYMHKAIDDMRLHIANLSNKPYNAILYGATGTGKTFLASCIANEFLKLKKTILFISVSELINSLFDKSTDEKLETYAYMCDLLVLDDLGTEVRTDFFVSLLHSIIDNRLVTNKSTILTTNLSPHEMVDKYFDATMSRINGSYSKYLLQGEDIRRINKYVSI